MVAVVQVAENDEASLARFSTLESYYFDDENETVSIIDEGLWIRQSDRTGSFILNADRLDTQTWEMNDVSVFFFDENATHTRRIDAQKAVLQPQRWLFTNVMIQANDGQIRTVPNLSLATTLTTIARNDADALSGPAEGLRSQLVRAYPQLAGIE